VIIHLLDFSNIFFVDILGLIHFDVASSISDLYGLICCPNYP